MLSTYALFLLFAFFVTIYSQNSGVSSLKALKTDVDPIRTFDLPADAPRARIISIDFLKRGKGTRKMKTTYRDNSGQDDFRRWKLDELTDRDMRSSSEVKKSAKSPFSTDDKSSEEVGDFFPTRE